MPILPAHFASANLNNACEFKERVTFSAALHPRDKYDRLNFYSPHRAADIAISPFAKRNLLNFIRGPPLRAAITRKTLVNSTAFRRVTVPLCITLDKNGNASRPRRLSPPSALPGARERGGCIVLRGSLFNSIRLHPATE